MSKSLLGLKGLENYLEQRDIVGYASICSLHLERANYKKGTLGKMLGLAWILQTEMLIAVFSLGIQVSKDTKYSL